MRSSLVSRRPAVSSFVSRFLHSPARQSHCPAPPLGLREICDAVSRSVGGLDELESSLDQRFRACLTSPLVAQVVDHCENEAPARRLLRFFLWSRKVLGLELRDEEFNRVVRVVARKKDHVGFEMLLVEMAKDGRAMEPQTFGVVAGALVRMGREDEALGVFKNLEKFKCVRDGTAVVAIVSALCEKGHAKKAQGVVRHHKDKVSTLEMTSIYKSVLYGWVVMKDVKEARRVIKEMKGAGIMPDLFCYNTFLKGLCEQNVMHNPSGLVPEALNVMMEMRSHRIQPNSISYNVLLSCLGRVRRVKEACRVLELMKSSGCRPDWVSYYLVARVLYLSGRFGKGNKIVDEMISEELVPEPRFYYDLVGVLCGVDRPGFALELLDRMKRMSMGGYGPVYDILIPKFCRGGEFNKGRELWDEAMAMGVILSCTSDVLDPSVTEVFKPTRKVDEEVKLVGFTKVDTPEIGGRMVRKRTKGKLKKDMKKK